MTGPPRRGSARRPEDDGFTLIELLVVIIIIGILAAIAIPVFLSQRERAFDSAAKSDLRVLAQFEETYATSWAHYADLAALDADKEVMLPTRGVTVSVVRYDGLTYCLSSKHEQSTTTFYYDSAGGGLQAKGATGCPVTTTGTAGSSRTG
jgi:prepilin-type N-terminal cleavage/methylation domain-containing protein